MSSTSENNNDTDTNKQDANNNNNNKFDQFMTMGVDLWQTAATSWIVTYNELVKNASTITEYWLNLFQSPSSRIKAKEDKVKVE